MNKEITKVFGERIAVKSQICYEQCKENEEGNFGKCLGSHPCLMQIHAIVK